jgi:hypothetical protein
MKSLAAIILFAALVSVRAQTVANTHNVLHPIMKDGQRNAPSSLNQDPSLAAEYRNNPVRAVPTYPSTPAAQAAAAAPAAIVAKVDSSFTVSKISVIGAISGLKGRLYVTNIGSAIATPLVQLAVCNEKGFQIGSATKAGTPLAPNDSEKIDVLATNANAVDLKLLKLSPAH